MVSHIFGGEQPSPGKLPLHLACEGRVDVLTALPQYYLRTRRRVWP